MVGKRIHTEEEDSSSSGRLVTDIHVYMCMFPNSGPERALQQQYPVSMSTLSIHSLASKYHSPIKAISAPWRKD